LIESEVLLGLASELRRKNSRPPWWTLKRPSLIKLNVKFTFFRNLKQPQLFFVCVRLFYYNINFYCLCLSGVLEEPDDSIHLP